MQLKRFSLALAMALSLAGTALAAEPVKVVASFSVLGDLAAEVGGDHVEVTTLVGPNGDAHVFEPSPKDAKALGAASLLVENGLGLEHWLQRLVDVSGFKGTTVIASTGVEPRVWTGDADEAEELAKDSSGRAIDPHAWQNAANGILYVNNIVAGLSSVDPANAADYKANGDKLVAELQTIDARLKADFGALPEAKRKIVTSHDAFGYFGAAYGVTFIAPEGLSTESEVSASAIAAIIKQIRDEKIQAIFVENITDPRLLKQISQETGVKIGGELFSDALSPADGPAPTYVKMFQNNEAQLLSAMSGS
jgi:zinc/manganese transport system substrate-binding protein